MNLAVKLNQEIALNIVRGSDKGISYKLFGNVIKIGRADDNDVLLNDNKASRYHAQVENRNGAYWIVDTGSQHGIEVNGSVVKEKMLTLGDQIVIGTTMIVYGPAAPEVSRAPALNFADFGGGSSKTKFYIIIAVVLIAGFLFFQDKSRNKKAFNIKDENTIAAQIENITQDNEARQQEIMRKGKDTQQYAEAQAFYLKGFREFRESNYSRAIQFFETALTLYPDHPLAKRYLSRSRLKLNESVTAALERGEKYFQNQKYINAFNEYRTVMLLTNDLNNKNAQLAHKRIEAIQLILMNNR